MIKPTHRKINFICLVICMALLSFAYYLQMVKQLQPCPLCVVQRAMIFLLGVVFLIATLHHPKKLGQRVYALLTLLFSLLGGLAASRQLWLQAQPPDTTSECLPGLSFILKHGSVGDVIKVLTHGTDQCALVTWQLFGISIPGWILIFFGLFAVISVWLLLRKPV